MRHRPLLTLLCVLLAVLGAAGCGGGGSSSSGASSAASTTAAPPAFLGDAEAAKLRSERRRAGAAAPFVAPEADNSIPTFGSESNAAERRMAQREIGGFLRARSAGRWALACRFLWAPTRRGFEKLSAPGSGGCATYLRTHSTDTSDPLIHGLSSFRVSGNHAFALSVGPGGQQYIVPMNRENHRWRLTQAGPIAYPPGAP